MSWAAKLRKKEMMQDTFRAVVTIQVVRVGQTMTPQGPMMEQTKLQRVECSGSAGTPGEAVDNALEDGVEEFVTGLSRVQQAVVMPGPTRIGQ